MLAAALWLLLGLVLGSFVTAMSARLVGENAQIQGKTRSCCPACGHVLTVRELVPLGSYLWQRGRCRHCHTSIHWRYPVIELVMLLVAAATYARWGIGLDALLALSTATALMILWVADWETYLLPDEGQLALLGMVTLWQWRVPLGWQEMAWGLALSGGVGLLLHYGYYVWKKRHGLGFGDVKLLATSGLLLGIWHIPQFLLMSGVAGVVLGLIWRYALGRGQYFPFGPALLFALAVGLVMRMEGISPWPWL